MTCSAIQSSVKDWLRTQSKNYYPQVYVEDCKYIDVVSQQSSILSNSADDEYF